MGVVFKHPLAKRCVVGAPQKDIGEMWGRGSLQAPLSHRGNVGYGSLSNIGEIWGRDTLQAPSPTEGHRGDVGWGLFQDSPPPQKGHGVMWGRALQKGDVG